MALFMGKIDWTDPEFAKWKLCNLGELTVKQKEAFLDVDVSVRYFIYIKKKNKY